MEKKEQQANQNSTPLSTKIIKGIAVVIVLFFIAMAIYAVVDIFTSKDKAAEEVSEGQSELVICQVERTEE